MHFRHRQGGGHYLLHPGRAGRWRAACALRSIPGAFTDGSARRLARSPALSKLLPPRSPTHAHPPTHPPPQELELAELLAVNPSLSITASVSVGQRLRLPPWTAACPDTLAGQVCTSCCRRGLPPWGGMHAC